jgi:hypothetical protein
MVFVPLNTIFWPLVTSERWPMATGRGPTENRRPNRLDLLSGARHNASRQNLPLSGNNLRMRFRLRQQAPKRNDLKHPGYSTAVKHLISADGLVAVPEFKAPGHKRPRASLDLGFSRSLVQSSLSLFNNYLLQWRVVGWPPSLQGSFRRLGRKAQRGDAEQGLEARRGSGVSGDQRLSIGPRSPATTCFLRASMGSPRLRVGLLA